MSNVGYTVADHAPGVLVTTIAILATLALMWLKYGVTRKQQALILLLLSAGVAVATMVGLATS